MIGFLLHLRYKQDTINGVNECEVCREPFGEAGTVSCSRGHKFCVNCFRAYAKENILGLSKILLPCMASGCDEKYRDDVAKQWLDDELVKKLRQNGVRWTEGTENRSMSHMTEEDRKRIKREERLTSEAIRRCPECKKAIVKAGGCNHVICPSCETHMCYSCGIRVEASDYSHVCRNGNGWRQTPYQFFQQPQPYDPCVGYGHRPQINNEIRRIQPPSLVLDVVERTRLVQSIVPSDSRGESSSGAPSVGWREMTSVEMRLKAAVQLTKMFHGMAAGCERTMSGNGAAHE